MLKVGITGGIGSGKTTLTKWLENHGVVIVDADAASRTVVEPGKPALKEIAHQFGSHFVGADGQLDRAAMRELVFSNQEKRLALEAITHPRIRKELLSQLDRALGPYVVLSSPILFESGQSQMVDLNVVVDVPEALQIKRVISRDKNRVELIRKIMATQLDRQSRLIKADIVIDNSKSVSKLHQLAADLHQTLIARATKI